MISPAKTADWSSHLPTNVVVLPAINGEFDQQEGGEDHSADVEAIAPSNKVSKIRWLMSITSLFIRTALRSNKIE